MASREWKGFSEEELQLIKKQTSEPDLNNVDLNDNQTGKRAKFASRKPKKPTSTDKRLQLIEVNPGDSSLRPEQKLSRSSSEGSAVLSVVLDKSGEGRGQSTLIKVNSESQRYELLPSPTLSSEEVQALQGSEPGEVLHSCNVNVQETPDTELLIKEVPSPNLTDSTHDIKQDSKIILEEFEQRQKLLEAENAKRKTLLLKAIDDSKKRTLEESKKIVKVQSELAKLDFHLSSDVSILRSQIEEASVEYDKAQVSQTNSPSHPFLFESTMIGSWR